MNLKSFIIAVMVLAMAACGTPTIVEPPTGQPSTPPAPAATTAPLASPQPTALTAPTLPSTAAAPTAVPQATATLAHAGVLPAPLYMTHKGQIWRLEADGKTRTQITAEPPAQPERLAVTEFDISPIDGALAYVWQSLDGNMLIQTDAAGKNRMVLSEGVNYTPHWSPDGKVIAIRLDHAPEAPKQPGGGVYLIPAGGGTPQLLQGDDPVDPANPAPEARSYGPVAWSPDGMRLLLSITSAVVEGCELAIKSITTDALISLSVPAGMSATCGEGTWSRDGSSLYITLSQVGGAGPLPGLWRADARTGALEPVVAGETDGTSRIVHAPHQADDGQVYLFLATTPTPPATSGTVPSEYAMHRAAANGSEPQAIRADSHGLGLVLWDERGGGAVIQVLENGSSMPLVWLPADGDPAVKLPVSGPDVYSMRWGGEPPASCCS